MCGSNALRAKNGLRESKSVTQHAVALGASTLRMAGNGYVREKFFGGIAAKFPSKYFVLAIRQRANPAPPLAPYLRTAYNAA